MKKICFFVEGMTNAVPGYEPVEIDSLDDVITSSCNEIMIDNTIDFVSDEIMGSILSKVRKQGKISISGTDLVEVGRGLVTRFMDTKKASSLLGEGRVKLYTLQDIVNILEQRGFKILKKRVNHYKYTVIGMRQ